MNKKFAKNSDALKRLEDWYLNECNGDWEHSYGLTIETLDNPGWIVKIDLRETAWENLVVAPQVDQQFENHWIQIEVKDSQFIGCGGAQNLSEIIERFLSLVN